MQQPVIMQPEFWLQLERDVAVKVDRALDSGEAPRRKLVAYLRELEVMARTTCDRRQTIQIIASGRSLLGDREALEPQDGPFAHTFA